MLFISNVFIYQTFSRVLKLSELEEDLAKYEQMTSQILRKRIKHTKTKTTLSYYCQEKRNLDCCFCLTYSIEKDENGNDFAFLMDDKSQTSHSHIKRKKCEEMDFETMRRCFKVLEDQIWKFLSRNNKLFPKDILAFLLDEGHLTEKMMNLKRKYPKKFKKSLDNQANKIKRKIRRQRLNLSESTIKLSESFSSFFSEETFQYLNYLVDNSIDTIKGGNDDTKVLLPDEEESEEKLKCLIPIILY